MPALDPPQGDLNLLDHPVAQRLLTSTVPARMAYLASDGTPRVLPTWFHWNGEEIVMATSLAGPHVSRPAARVAALRRHPDVALTIDTETVPPNVLTIRGRAEVSEVDGLAAEYVQAARRYLGAQGADGYLAGMDQPGVRQARIAVRPSWVGVLDFETRPPGPLAG